ncbi:hypothetical protein [Arthrobacter sp. ISL-30]|uniref:hypothetical protein n=1 Tax=Arthrobacter sp. ISL-30 TaxID=2819109 RepID=UPI001BEC5C86|nr:hypothetical protein [Arthrobacter sp. ISL-30]MBT2515674.1 hypothetical protein [Arthrobacter sp. ISL-30]
MSITNWATSMSLSAQNRNVSSTAASPRDLESESGVLRNAGRLTCSPWEGLYVEDYESLAPADKDATTALNDELEAFLDSLMYGE